MRICVGALDALQTHIKVNNLGKQGADDKDQQDIHEPLVELGDAPDLGENGGTEALGAHDAQAADPAADGDVDQHVLLAPPRSGVEGSDQRADDDEARVGEEARGDDKLLHLLDVVDGRLVRGVHNNDDGPDDAQEAGDLADHAEALLEEDGRQDGRDDDGQGAQRRDQDGVGEGVGDEITNLAKNHQRHAGPPVEVLEVAVALAGSLVVFLVGFEQADLLEDEGYTDEQARGDGK